MLIALVFVIEVINGYNPECSQSDLDLMDRSRVNENFMETLPAKNNLSSWSKNSLLFEKLSADRNESLTKPSVKC